MRVRLNIAVVFNVMLDFLRGRTTLSFQVILLLVRTHVLHRCDSAPFSWLPRAKPACLSQALARHATPEVPRHQCRYERSHLWMQAVLPSCRELRACLQHHTSTGLWASIVLWGRGSREVIGRASLPLLASCHGCPHQQGREFLLIESAPEKPECLIYEGQCN